MEEPTVVSSFLDRFFRPQFIESFQSPLQGDQTVRVTIFRSPDEENPTILDLNDLYPFMTIQDIKTRIYMEMNEQAVFHPTFQSLQIPVGDDITFETMTDYYTPLEFDWLKPGTSIAYTLMNPFKRATTSSVDTNFVTSTGQRKVVGFVSRGRASIEDVVLSIYDKKEIIIHCFLYKGVEALINPSLKTSEREWYGRLGPYFPELQPGSSPDSILPQQKAVMDSRVTYLKRSIQMMSKLDQLIQETPLYTVGMAGVKFLRIIWKELLEPNEQRDLETTFYELPVNSVRPFLRILPSDGVPITKIKVRLGKIPEISDPRLLLQWAQERNPTPDQDFVFAKTVIRRAIGVQPELYGTLRLFDDSSADFIVIPSKQLRKLEPKSDLVELSPLLAKTIEDTYLSKTQPEIGEASVICGVRLPTESIRFTKSILRKRLAVFKPLFQEITPLPGEQPLVMLRYKAVSNFATEDKVFSFITQLTTRRLLQGDAQGAEIVEAVEEEFQMNKEEAQLKVADWYRTSGQATLTVPETKDYIMTYNKGIDIAIFGQHPFYSFHLYRVDSIQTLERLTTALSLLFSVEDDALHIPAGIAEELEQAEQTLSFPGTTRATSTLKNTLKETETEIVTESEDKNIGAANIVAGQDFYGDEAMFDFDVMDEAVENASVAEMVRAEVESPMQELEETLPVAPPVNTKKVILQEDSEKEDDEEKGKKTYKKYLIRKLQEVDRRLFEYKDKNPKVKVKKYVSMCQATETRQPAVLNQEQYERMKDEYPEVTFIEYPMTKANENMDITDEYYTVLKYGSDPARQNYYLCSEFFCIKDHILVREADFYSTKDRSTPPKTKLGESRAGAKDRGSCPFCHGELIKSLDSPGKNQTVIHRAIKKKSKDDKRHLYIGFVKDTPHPEGFYLPCCFTADSPILISDKQFEHIRASGQTAPEAELLEDEEREEGEQISAAAGTPVPMLDYQVTLARVYRKYIVGPEKFPLKLGDLEGPQIGLLPAVLDAYFSQNPAEFVSRDFNRMELKPDSKGFLRIGVENRSRYIPDSFFAAIAPAMFRNSAAEVKKRLQEVITPRIFLFLNFGNMVLEFFSPELPEENDTKIRMWASKELNIDMSAANQEAIKRLYKSYHNFLRFLDSTTELKEYRQFAQALALPGLITPRGFVCIVLDMVEEDKLEVRCPPYGYDLDQYSGSDIFFLLHHFSGVWEPIFYTENRAPSTDPEFPVRHETSLLFQRGLEAGWPDIVKQRVREFMKKCVAPSRGEFTSQSSIDNLAIIPLNTAIEYSQPPPVGIVRDAYNHIVALTYRSVSGPRSGLVALPVVDDGTIVSAARIYLDWDDYQAAPIDEVIKYYKSAFEGFFSLYPGYIVSRLVKSSKTDKFIAIQLKNGIYIPATDPKDPSILSGYPMVVVTDMEWSLNREIYYSKSKDQLTSSSSITANEDELKEIYEHLRLTFSKWFSSEAVGPDLRDQIESILFTKKIPLYEQRKRLEILLGTTILSWMDTEVETDGTLTSLLRVDCNLRAEQNCSGRCVWRKSEEKCLLHAPKEVSVNSIKVNGPNLLKNQLIEELLRFPERRKQMLEGSVPTLVSLRDAILMGDQYIVPETSVAWFDLMRLDWVPTGKEKKRFFEEMSSEAELPVATRATEPQIPGNLAAVLGADDPLLRYVHFYKADQVPGKSPLLPYLIPLGTSSYDLGIDETSVALTDSAVRKLVSITGRPIIQIDVRGDEPVIFSYGPSREQKGGIPIIFVITSEGPAILSSSSAHPSPILPDDLPSGLKDIYEERVTLVFKRKKIPV